MVLEDTQKVDPERESLIQEMLRDAESKTHELPSELIREPVISTGAETQGAPMVVNKISSAGYVTVWDTRTYKTADVLYYRLPQVLRKRRPDGSYQWITNDPGKLPARGTYKCMLHADSPDRAHYDELGLRLCKKENMWNPQQVRQHMRSRHRVEWETIEQGRIEKERQEDRADRQADRQTQQMLVGSLAGKALEPKRRTRKKKSEV